MGDLLASIADRYSDHAKEPLILALSMQSHNHVDALIVRVDAVTISHLYVQGNSLSGR